MNLYFTIRTLKDFLVSVIHTDTLKAGFYQKTFFCLYCVQMANGGWRNCLAIKSLNSQHPPGDLLLSVSQVPGTSYSLLASLDAKYTHCLQIYM